MSLILMTPAEVATQIGLFARELRLSLNLSQKNLSEHAGVSLGVLKKFERTGKISLDSLLKLSLALNRLGDFIHVLDPSSQENLPSLDELLQQKTRKRGRK